MTADALSSGMDDGRLTPLSSKWVEDCVPDLPAWDDTAFDQVEGELPCIGKFRRDLYDGIESAGAPLRPDAATLLKHVRLAVKHISVEAKEDDPMVLLKFVASGTLSSSHPVDL